ncbi:MAG TPA: hypothetical protein VF121_04025 [Thermoanaerobaculia bacterium]|nr:hypothetical protein [Thermoanaerobaculia bacterium]
MPTVKGSKEFRLTLGVALKGDRRPQLGERKLPRAGAAKPTTDARTVHQALARTAGAEAILKEVPSLDRFQRWLPVATFSVCQKTGTATYLDIWDADHFDGFTDMQRCITDCRAWFSADGYQFWGSAQTKTGRINCYFRAPTAGAYVCNAQLLSHGGPAQVECLIDDFNYGPLPFNGPINQPHPANLSAGYHSFRIRQRSGSLFFISLTVWRA